MDVNKLKAEALRLSLDKRAYLAKELLNSLEIMSEAEIEKLWMDEAARREKELDQGIADAYPANEVLTRLRAQRK